ncbi:MAG: YafY family protein [Arachnia sp.]
MADVTERMLRLLATLQAGRAYSGDELAARLDVSPRTLRRDVERLRAYGYPVRTRPGPGGSYQLEAGQRMPPLVLDDDEAIATVVGLATLSAAAPARPGGLTDAADRAYGKIDTLLPARLRPKAGALRAGLEAERRTSPDVDADAVGVLADAIAAQEVVAFDYIDAHGVPSRRRVEPHRQVYLDLRWYVLCWDLDRDDWRVFRTDRITNPQSTLTQYQPRPLPEDSAVAYLRSGLRETFEPMTVIIETPMLAAADALRHLDADLEAVGETRTRATVVLDSWQRLLPALSHLDADFRITAPQETVTAIRQFAQRLSDAVQTS